MLSRRRLTLLQPVPEYREFFLPGKCEAGSCRRIEVVLDESGDGIPAGAVRLFESGESWSVYADGKQRCLVHRSNERKEVHWMAHFALGGRRVRLSLGAGAFGNSDGLVNPLMYPLDQLLLMYLLSRGEGVITHAAGLQVEGRGVIFAGRSGAGKSTIVRLLKDSGCSDALSDDRVVVRKRGRGFCQFGTPWPGELKVAANRRLPLDAICFLRHEAVNRMTRLRGIGALERFLPLASIPWYEKSIVPQMVDFCERLTASIPVFELAFRPDASAAAFVRREIGRLGR
ncbi:MAG: hypothetical protein C0404_01220 [Verrucomicrobia bacterium]|nr:hypothetical protein [Verrucomicrobiota bacterium]